MDQCWRALENLRACVKASQLERLRQLESMMRVRGVLVNLATKVVCVVAAITSLIIVCARIPGMHSSDLPVLALVVAPYLLLVLLAGSVGERSSAAKVLFITTLLLALWGTALLGLSTSHPGKGPELGLAMTVTMIGVPLLQLGAVIVFGLVLLLRRIMTYKGGSGKA